MMWILAIFVAGAGLFVILCRSESARRRREVEATFRAIVVENADGVMDFKGADATVHGRHSTFVGGDMDAPDGRLRTQYLCKDPGGCGFEVVVEGASGIGRATAQVKPLSEAEFQYLLSRYPCRRIKRSPS
jgi:hypothetical protein